MALFQWKPEFAVGIEIIDQQHQILVKLINKLHRATEDVFHEEVIENILKELFDYTRYHFTTEEELMAKYGYEPQKLEKHKKQHQLFISELNASQSDLDTMTREDAVLIQEFLVNWLKNHILKIDVQLAEFLLHYQESANHANTYHNPSIRSAAPSGMLLAATEKSQQLAQKIKALSENPNGIKESSQKAALIELADELVDVLKNLD